MESIMYLRFGSLLVLLGAGVAMAGAASAEEYRAYKASRAYVREAPVKDCTRFNGRFGYYGNPWCSPREQAAWDAWSDRRR
jgi:hypothetical protein